MSQVIMPGRVPVDPGLARSAAEAIIPQAAGAEVGDEGIRAAVEKIHSILGEVIGHLPAASIPFPPGDPNYIPLDFTVLLTAFTERGRSMVADLVKPCLAAGSGEGEETCINRVIEAADFLSHMDVGVREVERTLVAALTLGSSITMNRLADAIAFGSIPAGERPAAGEAVKKLEGGEK